MDIEKINVGGTQYDVCDTVARAAVSDEFSTGATYAAGDYCIYENTLYKFTAAKEPGAWDASKVAATQIGDELSQLNGKIPIVQSGSQNVTLTGVEQTINIDFPTPFPSAPKLCVSVQRFGYAAETSVVIRSVGTHSASFTVVGTGGGSTDAVIFWIAVL